MSESNSKADCEFKSPGFSTVPNSKISTPSVSQNKETESFFASPIDYQSWGGIT